MTVGWYDREGQPIADYPRWAHEKWGNDFDAEMAYKRVAKDRRGDVAVSTVWLGLNHQFGDGPPLIFETMVFGGDHDDEQWRYSTEVEALAGHAEVCSAVLR